MAGYNTLGCSKRYKRRGTTVQLLYCPFCTIKQASDPVSLTPSQLEGLGNKIGQAYKEAVPEL
jgi:hypothetical protein